MITCPVCEHQQARGTECEVCGKVFAPAAAPDLPAAPLEGVERTAIADRRIAIQVQPMAELEQTAPRAGPDLPAQRLADMQQTRTDEVGAVPVEVTPGLDRAREEMGERTAPPVGPVTCRYCRNVQASGLFCDKCGMRLPKVEVAEGDVVVGKLEEADLVRCRFCGAPAKPGERCGDCARWVPLPDE